MTGTSELPDLLHQVTPVRPLGRLLLQLLDLLTLQTADLPVLLESWPGRGRGWRCRGRGGRRGGGNVGLLLILLKLVVRPVNLGPVDGDEVLGDGDLGLPGGVSGRLIRLLGLLLLPLPLVLSPLI